MLSKYPLIQLKMKNKCFLGSSLQYSGFLFLLSLNLPSAHSLFETS